MTNPSPEFTPAPQTDLDNRILGCLPGAYPWDDWQRDALASGLDTQLAALGRAVMREAYQHDWCDRLKYECGIDNTDTAAGMIACAKNQPHLVEARWRWLLATDGLRFDPWAREEWPEVAPEWNEMLKRWQTERAAENTLSDENQLLQLAVEHITFFYNLNQLAIIDLEKHAVNATNGKSTLWADFTVIGGPEPERHRIIHSGVVRIDLEPDGDAAIFERVEES